MHDTPTYLVAFWSPFFPFAANPYLGYFSAFFQKYGDIQCLDCKDSRDVRTMRLLGQADLVVIILRQSFRDFTELLCRNTIRFGNYVCLVADYVAGGEPDLRQIRFAFRIPASRLACIPYLPRIRGQKNLPGHAPVLAECRRELTRAGQIMLLALGF